MKPRAIFFDSIVFLLWALICFYESSIVSFDIIFSGFGVVFGLGFGVLVALRQTRNLEIKGEIKTTLKTWVLILLVSVPTAFCLVFLLSIYGSKVGVPMVSFLVPAVPAMYLAKIIFSLNWERKNKRLILYDFNRTYATSRNS